MKGNLMEGVAMETRPYQLRIVEKVIAMFEGRFTDQDGNLHPPADSLLIESPTASGKGPMGLMTSREMQLKHGYRVGWIAMRRNLLAQAEAENRERGFNVDMHLISMFDKCPPEVDLVIIDEAQHDATLSMANLLASIRPKKILGLSATPYRRDHHKLCFEKVVKDAGIHQLIQDGYLSPYHHYTLPKYTPETVANCFAKEPTRWGQSLIFFYRRGDCQACHSLLSQQGIPAEVVTAESARFRQIEDFTAGRIQVLFSMAILTEGFDCPSLKTVFCRPSGKLCTVQMGGRVFRLHPDVPYKQIVQCRETRHPFPRTAAPAEQYVWTTTGWKSIGANSQLARIATNSLRLIAASRNELPHKLMQK